MDDTRDIAVRAETGVATAQAAAAAASAQAAAAAAAASAAAGKTAQNEQRLNGINGQIARLASSHDEMRGDFNRALYGVGEGDGGLVGSVAELRNTIAHAFKVGGIVLGAVVTMTTSYTVYNLEQHHTAPATPPARRVVVHQHKASRRHVRVSSGQLIAAQQQR